MGDVSTLGELIRARRRELGLTQEALAKRIGGGIRQSDISRLEKGKVVLPRRDRLEHIAAALELRLGELLAHSGWTGADAAFVGPASRPEPAPTAAGPNPPPRVPSTPALRPPSTGSPRLRDALIRSQQLRARTADLLSDLTRQAEATWGPPFGTTPNDEAATPEPSPCSGDEASDHG